MSDKIDVVILWVDGSDPHFVEQKVQWRKAEEDTVDDSVNRYRDWGLLRYVLRGLEMNLPWVGNLYVITSLCQKPNWLQNTGRLRLVDIESFMPANSVPSFNSNSIQLCLHRIPDLADRFILWDDDMIPIRPMKESDFFVGDLPCCQVGFARLTTMTYNDPYAHSILNDVGVINQHFSFRVQFRKYWRKWISLKNSIPVLLRSLGYIGHMDHFYWGYYPHMPQAYLKDIFKEVWNLEGPLLESVVSHRFRSKMDLTHKLMLQWQVASGQMMPCNIRSKGAFLEHFPKDLEELRKIVHAGRKQIVCINDSFVEPENYEQSRCEVVNTLEQVLPMISQWEDH